MKVFQVQIWGFPDIGLPQSSSHFNLGFSLIIHPAIGYPHDYGTLQLAASWTVRSRGRGQLRSCSSVATQQVQIRDMGDPKNSIKWMVYN